MTTLSERRTWWLDFRDARDTLVKVARSKPADHVCQIITPNDTYAFFDQHTGQPSCIIGHLLFALGVTASQVDDADVNTDCHVSTAVQALGIDMDYPTVRMLGKAQEWNDRGVEWGMIARRIEQMSDREV